VHKYLTELAQGQILAQKYPLASGYYQINEATLKGSAKFRNKRNELIRSSSLEIDFDKKHHASRDNPKKE